MEERGKQGFKDLSVGPNTISPPFDPKSPPMDPKSTLQAHPHHYIREYKRKLSSTSPPNFPISLSKKLKASEQAPSLQFSLNNLPQLSESNPHSLLSPNLIPVASSSQHSSRRASLKDQARVKAVSRVVRFKNGKGDNSETLNLSSNKSVAGDNSSTLINHAPEVTMRTLTKSKFPRINKIK